MPRKCSVPRGWLQSGWTTPAVSPADRARCCRAPASRGSAGRCTSCIKCDVLSLQRNAHGDAVLLGVGPWPNHRPALAATAAEDDANAAFLDVRQRHGLPVIAFGNGWKARSALVGYSLGSYGDIRQSLQMLAVLKPPYSRYSISAGVFNSQIRPSPWGKTPIDPESRACIPPC